MVIYNVNKYAMAVGKENKFGIYLAAVTGGAAVALSIICYPFVSPALRKICLPYVPATTKQVENVLDALRGRSGLLLDIGSGDGRIILTYVDGDAQAAGLFESAAAVALEWGGGTKVMAAAKAGFPSHGVELNPWLVTYSRLKALISPASAPVSFYCKDLWKFPLEPYKNIVIFGVEEMMEDLEKKLDLEIQKDACIVACRFPLPGKIPNDTLGDGVDAVWVYKR